MRLSRRLRNTRELARTGMLALLASVGGCGGSNGGSGASLPAPTPPPSPPAVVQKGERILEIQVNETADGEFVTSFNQALALGAQSQTFSVDWSAIDLGVDGDGEPIYDGGVGSELLALANACYPNSGTRISMMLRPITTLAKTVPPDLEDVPFDDPALIERFRQTLDHVFSLIPEIEITSLALGSEIDLYLSTPSLRDEFEVFYAAAAEHARSAYADMYPGKPPLLVTTEVTHKSLLEPTFITYYMELHQHSDTVGVSYYPLDNDRVQSPDRVGADFSDLVGRYGDRPLVFFQLGYPSGYFSADFYPELDRGEVVPALGSSEQLQADFVDAVFEAWDRHAEVVRLISFTWMNDKTAASVAETIANPAFGGGVEPSAGFVEFLRTLGLRSDDGVAKMAYRRLEQGAAARGWAGDGTTFSCD